MAQREHRAKLRQEWVRRIHDSVVVSFVEERERVIRHRQEAIRELSTPALPVRERLLILP